MEGEEARVTVSVRVRPKITTAVNSLQQSERYEDVICLPTSDTSLRLAERRQGRAGRNLHFAYDHVFDHDATQEEVYETAALDGVDQVLSGTNTSLLTYGQTGSGKTYTVLGKVAHAEAISGAVGEDSGLLLRAIQDMLTFAERMHAKGQRHVVLGITAIEIYNDEIRDLLRSGTSAAPLQPIMTRDTLYLPGLTHLPLHSLRDACAVYERAAARRVQRATSANDTSSRSHAIFTVEVFQTPVTPANAAAPTLAECCALRSAGATTAGAAVRTQPKSAACCFDGAPNVFYTEAGTPVMYSALTVADLAGSEKAKHADVHGTGFDELRRINASLTALGNVVHHLFHNSAHVPYRDSKLTMVLRDTFAAPRARVLLFVNVSPTGLTSEETLSSLYFADKMKGMTAPDVAASPQQAALQSSYLAALREHDALLADLHIFQTQHELPVGLLQRVVSSTAGDHPLQQLPFHTVVRDSTDKAHRLGQLCADMRTEVAREESPEARMAEAARRELRKSLLRQYSQRRAEAHAGIAAAEETQAGLSSEAAAARAEAQRALTAAAVEAQKAQTARRALVARLTELRSAEAAAVQKESVGDQSSTADTEAASPQEASAVREHGTEEDSAVAATHRKAVEVAEMRQLLVDLVAFRVRTVPAPPADGGDADAANTGVTPRETSRSRSGTASSGRRGVAVEEWVRSAVLAMAGNAVVQSMKRRARLPRETADRPPLGDVTNLVDATPGTAKAQQLPKFWQLGRPGKEGEKRASGAHAAASAFDDPDLLTRLTAYMDMGAALVKVDRTGRGRERWFYLTQRQGRFVLHWDEARRGAGLGGGGHVYLDAVAKITLGRSSPGFLKHAAVTKSDAAAELEAACTSFSVVYHSRSNHRDLKFVDVVCPDMKEMETWVVGLAHWAGVSPLFEDARQPDDAAEAPRSSAGASAGDASLSERATTTAAASVALDAQEAVLARVWHIPAALLAATRDEVQARRQRHRSGQMRLTPGQLRDLTGLDIFRASALWRHFEARGWVLNATGRLCCFVRSEEGGDAPPRVVASDVAVSSLRAA